ncbi:unnamed protein product [Scytosiphon promiscuus]
MDEAPWPIGPRPEGGLDGTSTANTQAGSPKERRGAAEGESGRSRDTDESQNRASTATRLNSSSVPAADTSGGRASGKFPSRGVRVGAKRVMTTADGFRPLVPRVTAEPVDERPNLSNGGGGGSTAAAAAAAGEDAGVDAELLNAALQAVLADATLSREGLHRMLNARQRRPLREDSSVEVKLPCRNGEISEDGVGSGGGSRKPSPREDGRHRRCLTMNDRWAEEIFRAMDHDHSGSITFTDFVAGCLVEKQVGETALRTAFARLDHTRSGLISLEDVRMYLGEDFREEEMVRNMRAISSRADGQVSYDDFKKCLLGGAQPNSRVVTPALSRSASFKALSKLASSTQLNMMGGEEKDLEAEEKAVFKAAAVTDVSAMMRAGI